METEERKQKQVWLDQSFTVDILHINPDGPDEAVRFSVALSATGSLLEYPPMRVGFSDTLIGAVIAFYPDHGDGYAIQPETIEHPAGMSRNEAIAVIKAMFEKSGRGAEADEDWAWLPIVLSDYLAKIFPWPRYEQIAELLRQEVRDRNAQVSAKEK
jgi:hypothetical protein